MSVHMQDAVTVVINGDHDLVVAFLDWQLSNDTYSLPVGGMSGAGRYVGTFAAEHAPAIRSFFHNRELAKRRERARRKKAGDG